MKCKPELLHEIIEWIKENGLQDYGGATLTSLTDAFKIDRNTFYSWMRKPAFSASIENAKEVFKSNLEKKLVDSLAKAAEGYVATYERTEYVNSADGKPIINKKIVEKKPVVPSVAANIYLLGNINPEKWKNRQSSEVTGADGEPLAQAPITIQISEAKPSKVEVER